MWRRGNFSLWAAPLSFTADRLEYSTQGIGLSAAGQLSLFSTRERKKIVLGVMLVDGCVDIL